MPITKLQTGKLAIINKCTTKEDTRRFLECLGIVPGAVISVVSEVYGNLVVDVKGSKIAINRDLARELSVFEQ